MGNILKLEIVSGVYALDISDVTNYLWLGHSGFGLAALHRLLVRGPQQSGDTDMGYLLDPRLIQLSILLRFTDAEDLFTKHSQLVTYLNPTNAALALRLTHVTTGIISQIDCFNVNPVDFDMPNYDDLNLPVPLSLYCNDPTWYDPTPLHQGFSAGGGGDELTVPMTVPFGVGASIISQTAAINYAGTADSFPWLTISGPISDPIIRFSDSAGIKKLDFTGFTINTGDTRIIDTRYPTKTVVDSSGVNKSGELTNDSNLAELKINKILTGETSHVTTISVAGLNANDLTRIDANYLTRFISAR